MDNHLQQLIKHLLSDSDSSLSLSQQTISQLKLAPSYPIILIGGTNGKGSTCAYLSTILSLSGYRVGSYTSPHVLKYNERIRLNNCAISDLELSKALQQVIDASPHNLGLFNTFTLAAHGYFCQQHIDIAVVEVGIGGEYDVTNLFAPEIAAITTIGLDHCHLLGSTLADIGLTKAKIFRRNKFAVLGSTQIPTSVIDYAQQLGAQLYCAGKNYQFHAKELSWDFHDHEQHLYSLPLPGLRGAEQLNNAALALAILGRLRQRFPIPLAYIKEGLLKTTLIGRFQRLPGQPQVILDTAHNPQAVECMLQNMLKLPFAKRTLAIFGVAADKDWQQILALASPHIDEWFLAAIDSKRSLDPQQMQQFLIKHNAKALHIYPTIAAALAACYGKLTPADRVIAFGSFMVVEAVYRQLIPEEGL